MRFFNRRLFVQGFCFVLTVPLIYHAALGGRLSLCAERAALYHTAISKRKYITYRESPAENSISLNIIEFETNIPRSVNAAEASDTRINPAFSSRRHSS